MCKYVYVYAASQPEQNLKELFSAEPSRYKSNDLSVDSNQILH